MCKKMLDINLREDNVEQVYQMFDWSPQRAKNQNEAEAIYDKIKLEIFTLSEKKKTTVGKGLIKPFSFPHVNLTFS